nr:ribonuclease H-like domain-containing protein [Tanacetum cinerariifolium]
QDDLEEMDLKWQVAMLFMRVKQFYKKTRRKLEFNGKEPVGFVKTKVEFITVTEEGTLPGIADQPGTQEIGVEMLGMHGTEKEIMVKGLQKRRMKMHCAKVKTGLGYDSQFNEKEVLVVKEEEVPETVFDNRSSDEENSLANDRFKKGEGYHVVPPPLTRNYMHPKSNLSFARLDDFIYKF